jgi:ferritin
MDQGFLVNQGGIMHQEILDLLQKQFTLERTNEQYYSALASAADCVNWPGASKYFEGAANDEQSHAKRVRDHIIDRNAIPVFDMIETMPAINGADYAGMFNLALQREQMTTAALNAFYQAADDVNTDPQAVALLVSSQGDWPGYLQEQTDSERELTDYLLKIGRLGPDGIELFDQWLAEQ